MAGSDEFRARARATWAAGNWDKFSSLIAPVGASVLGHIAVEPGMELLDVGTGNGANVAIPAAEQGAKVTGLDVTPELLAHAQRRADEAGVDVTWVEGEAMELPFPDDSFDRVVSTFGTMFAPDHRRAVAELVRVLRPGGRIAMTTWQSDGLAGRMFELGARFLPPPPPGVGVPTSWASEDYIREVFTEAAGTDPTVLSESVAFEFPSVDETVRAYTEEFGVFVTQRAVLEPQGKWDDYVDAFRGLVTTYNEATDGTARLRSDYFVILV